ncbi:MULTISPECIES: hypothetical protein [Arthrobacter]|uniref:Parallel beta helix pectate lyase-like protein n=1 Tax=Arthrobacter oryzae TaxID=409290 RepID=A0A3N0BNP8_9MICC|nr:MULTISPECIES: hypothetical protein [Arthrobacter]QYF89031.1 hypothetical protein KY499_12750 [Arthrobacter sp. PAMC25284]RNL50491.1 hypothetical protein D7003_16535 [Arthrobacter oryzae]
MKIKPTTIATLVTLVLLTGVLEGAASPSSAPAGVSGGTSQKVSSATTYYVSDAGNDDNAGTSEKSPWKSLSRLNVAVLSPGDRVSLRRGDTWNGGLLVGQSGAEGAPITVTGYGTGEPPTIVGGYSGDCVRIQGSHVIVDGLRAAGCGYAGFSVDGDRNVVTNSVAEDNAAGIKVGGGSDFGRYTNNRLANNNVMNVNTKGSGCGAAGGTGCNDDSGAFGVLINGNDNEFSGNIITGSTAPSHDFIQDGSAFEIFNGSRNNIHHNRALDNNVFSEIGRSAGKADGNTFSYNLVRATCGAGCAKTTGLIVRGPNSSFGPTYGTVFEHNTVLLDGPDSKAVVCYGSCPASTVIRGNILVAVRNSLWMDGSGWTERQNVLNGPSNVALDGSSTKAPAGFVDAPSDLRLTATSPAIDLAGASPFGADLEGRPAVQNGGCARNQIPDAGAYEYSPPGC